METMTQEEKELLLRDICARLPYGVKVNVKGVVYDNRSCRLTDIHYGLDTYIGAHDGMQYHIENIKPYLFPLSSMTEEQNSELLNIVKYCEIELKDNDAEFWSLIMDVYNKHHIDYRGLIPMGLAIDATGLNVY